MIIGKVIGNVWATRKLESLSGLKFMVVELIDETTIIACDSTGAGIGDKVLISQGTRIGEIDELVGKPVDAAIIGIIDEGEGD